MEFHTAGFGWAPSLPCGRLGGEPDDGRSQSISLSLSALQVNNFLKNLIQLVLTLKGYNVLVKSLHVQG